MVLVTAPKTGIAKFTPVLTPKASFEFFNSHKIVISYSLTKFSFKVRIKL